jgi:hypothetical protein
VGKVRFHPTTQPRTGRRNALTDRRGGSAHCPSAPDRAGPTGRGRPRPERTHAHRSRRACHRQPAVTRRKLSASGAVLPVPGYSQAVSGKVPPEEDTAVAIRFIGSPFAGFKPKTTEPRGPEAGSRSATPTGPCTSPRTATRRPTLSGQRSGPPPCAAGIRPYREGPASADPTTTEPDRTRPSGGCLRAPSYGAAEATPAA